MPEAKHGGGVRRPFPNRPLTFFIGVTLTVGAFVLFASNDHLSRKNPPATRSSPSETTNQRSLSLGGLLAKTPKELKSIDIAEMNLLCATGLPGTENLDIGKCLDTLNKWLPRVRHETNRHLYRVKDPRYAKVYKKSESYFRAYTLLQVLMEDCGVHYHRECTRNVDFSNPRDIFIHGMINDDNGGTCTSMPVLYVAVGRRLGYPMKLALAKGHVFARWESPDGKERFNIECTSEGAQSFPDEYYQTWPLKMTEAEVKNERYLKSLSPVEELALFQCTRGDCLTDIGRTSEALIAYTHAHRLAPRDPGYVAILSIMSRKVIAESGFARPRKRKRRVTPSLTEIELINAINRANMRRMAQPPNQPYGPVNPYQPYRPPTPGQHLPHRPPVPGQPHR